MRCECVNCLLTAAEGALFSHGTLEEARAGVCRALLLHANWGYWFFIVVVSPAKDSHDDVWIRRFYKNLILLTFFVILFLGVCVAH